jgi:hypothetical protein
MNRIESGTFSMQFLTLTTSGKRISIVTITLGHRIDPAP